MKLGRREWLAGMGALACASREPEPARPPRAVERYAEKDLLEYAPTTRENVAKGFMTVEALAEATVVVSDNTAANLLLEKIGGPQGLTLFFRSLGDEVTRLDRNEPTLNTNLAGDPRDTTSPRAMVHAAKRALSEAALSAASRARLIGWMT